MLDVAMPCSGTAPHGAGLVVRYVGVGAPNDAADDRRDSLRTDADVARNRGV